jgi:hypothetical protein
MWHSLEKRREALLKDGWEEVLPRIFMGERHHVFAHLCDRVKEVNAAGGFLEKGKCKQCGFVPDKNIRFMMKLVEFKK